ncbi:MAG TPA: hypothetical protein VIO11_08295 [Candidatus Methanoperedens sp.]
MTKTRFNTLSPEVGKEIIEKELKGCLEAEYVFSMVTDLNDKDVRIPVILLKKNLKNKDRYLGVAMESRWLALNGDMSRQEAWMFLNIDFGKLGVLKFKFNLFDANVRKWIETLIYANGNAVLCDRNDKTDFDVGLSNIPLDIPVAQLTLTAFFLANKRSAVAG